MSGLLEREEYQDIFRKIGSGIENNKTIIPDLYYLNIGTIRNYLQDSYWKNHNEFQIIDKVKQDIEQKRKNISVKGCHLIIDFDGCGIFNKTLMSLCPKIIKQIIDSWTNIVWSSYIIRPNSFTTLFLNLIMTFIPHERHNKVSILKGGLIELIIILEKLGRNFDEKQWLHQKIQLNSKTIGPLF